MAIFGKMGVLWPLIIDQRLVHLTPHMFPCHRSHSWISGGDHFLGKNPNVLAFGIFENGHSWLFSTKMGVVWPLIFDQRLIHLTTHMFPCHRSHSWIYCGDHLLVKNPLVFAFSIIENGRSWLFSTKMGVVWPFIIDQRLIHLTPHMFPCHRLHSWISGGNNFLVKNSYMLAFDIIENGRSWLFSTKMGVVWPLIIDQRLIHLTPHMFPCHRSHSWIYGGDHFLVKNPYVLALSIFENGHSWLFSTKMGVVWPLIFDQRLIHLTTHMFPCHRSHSWIYCGDHLLVKNPLVFAFSIIENGRSWLFSTKMGVVWPFIIDQRLIHLTPHMFPCH